MAEKKRKREEQAVPKKQVCVVHYNNFSSDATLTSLTDISYATLLKSKDIRTSLGGENHHFQQCQSIPVQNYNPGLHGYHRQCYQKFTKAKTIKPSVIDSTATAESTSHYILRGSSEPSTSSRVLFPDTCGICNKHIIKVKGKKQYPVTIVTRIAADTLKKAAELHDDQEMLTKVRTADLIAMEFRKHERCYLQYTRITRDKTPDELHEAEDAEEDTLVENKFDNVCELVETHILQRNQSLSMSMLHEAMEIGVGDRRYRHRLKEKLKETYGDSLLFVTVESNKPQIVINAASLNQPKPLSQFLKMNEEQTIKQAAVILRQHILDFTKTAKPLPWPPTVEALQNTDRLPPHLVQSFFTNVLKSPKHSATEKVAVLSKSFSEDLIHGVTHGQFLTAKHALVGVVLHNLTGQKTPVNVLFRLGHSASYDQVCEIETGLAELTQHFQEQGQLLPLQPKSTSSSVLTVFWMDNFDHNIETSTGHGTIHNTHGVAYQEQSDSSIARKEAEEIPRSKRHSLVSVAKELEHRVVNAKLEPPKFIATPKSALCIDSIDNGNFKLIVWRLGRKMHNTDQLVPRFTGWLSIVANEQVEPTPRTHITYLPPIHRPITDYDTVVEYLSQVQSFARQVNMPFVHLTLDVGAVAKAFQVVWNFPEEYKNVIIHIGDFHLMQENFGIMGQLISNSGFEDIVFQAGLCASGSLNGVLRGKHYNRAWTVHEHFAEALERLLFQKFLETACQEIPAALSKLIESPPQSTNFEDFRKEPDVVLFIAKYEDFRQQIRIGHLGKTPQFWMIYLDMVTRQTLLHSAIKENDYNRRLWCWKNCLPMFFAFNKQNYARYGAYYVQSLETMEANYPGARSLIERQGLSVQRSSHKASRQAVDQAGEQTYNRSAKIPGGIKQFASNRGAYEKWVLNRPHLAKFKDALLEITGLQNSNEFPQKACRPSEIIKSEKRIKRLLAVLTQEFLNPFNDNLDTTKLYNLSSGAPVSTEIEVSLTTLVERGTSLFETFVADRLENDAVNFFAPISRVTLKTFKDSSKKVKVAAKGKLTELTAERDILGRLVALSNKHGAAVDIDLALSFTLGPVPQSLAHPDGTRRRTTKSKLLDLFLEYCKVVSSSQLPDKSEVSAYIVDLMAMVRLVTQIPETFGELALKILNFIPKGYNRIDIVADSYMDRSIKASERTDRGSSDKYLIKGLKTKVPTNLGNFLSNGSNKERLIELIIEVLEQERDKMPANQKIYFSKRNQCYLVTKEATSVVGPLSANHEEADTKIALHIQHALTTTPGPIIVRSPSGDTDIPVILVAMFPDCQHDLYLDNGHGIGRTIFNLSLCDIPIPNKKSLLGLHAFTGNDYVSAFARKGKMTCWALLQKYPKYNDSFIELGSNWVVDSKMINSLEEYVCKLYGRKTTQNVNDARQQIFWEKYNKNQQIVDLSLLPPCKDDLVLHIQRANYVCRIWRLSCTAIMNAPNPSSHGWTNDMDVLWTTKPLPQDLTSLLSREDTTSKEEEVYSDAETQDSSDDDEEF